MRGKYAVCRKLGMHRTFGSAELLVFEMFGGSAELLNNFFILIDS